MNEISFIALGGQDEKDNDLFVLEFNDSIFILDSGFEKPMQKNYGIKYFIPKMDYLVNNREKIRGIFLSNASHTKIGSLDHLLKFVPNVNVYGSTITLKTLGIYFSDHVDKWNLIPLSNKKQIIVGNVIVTPFTIASVLPGSYGYQFNFKGSNVIYLNGYVFDSIIEYNIPVYSIIPNPKDKVFLLLSDSTYGDETSINASYLIKDKVEDGIYENHNRTFVSIYENNVLNIIEIINIARQLQRKVYFTSKVLYALVTLYIENKIINHFKYELLNSQIKKPITNNGIVIISSDKPNQFNEMIDFVEQSKNIYNVEITEKDLVILASVQVNGNEHIYASLESSLSAIAPTMLKINRDEFREMHPNQFDLKNYLQVLKPKYLVPIKGFYKEQIQHKNVFLKQQNNSSERFIVTQNGQKATFRDENFIGLSQGSKEFGKVILEDSSKSDAITPNIIAERIELGKNGVVTLSIIISIKNKAILTQPDIQLRGVIFLKNENKLIEEVQDKFIELIEYYFNEDEVFDKNKIVQKTTKEITKILKARIKKTPIIIAKIIDYDSKK